MKAKKDTRSCLVASDFTSAEVTDRVERAIGANPTTQLFQRSGELIRIRTDGGLSRIESIRSWRTVGLILDGLIRFARRTDDGELVDSPKARQEACENFLTGRTEYDPNCIPHLDGFLLAPTICPDGRLIESPGYDEDTRLFGAWDATSFPKVPESPTRDDAAEALEDLRFVVGGYPFEEERHESGALAFLITGVVRRTIDHAPLFAVTAPQQRSGKTKLAHVAATLPTGRRSRLVTQRGTEDEESKRMFSLLGEGAAAVTIDNVVRAFRTEALSVALTEEGVTDRILGASRTATYPTRVLFSATGNNLEIGDDLAHRTVRIRIVPGVERPEERTFPFDPVEYAQERRGQLVTAVLTILRAHHVAGYPGAGILPPWGGFDLWTRMVRGALAWLGVSDCYETRAEVLAQDDATQDLERLAAIWPFGPDEEVTAADLVKRAEAMAQPVRGDYSDPDSEDDPGDPDLQQLLVEIAGGRPRDPVNVRELGKALGALVDRVTSGNKALSSPRKDRNKVNLWRLGTP